MANIKPLYAITDHYLPNLSPGAAIWVYRCVNSTGSQTGIWAATDPVDMARGKIVPHEAVLPKKLDHLVSYMNKNEVTRSPVLLTYKPHQQITNIIADICSQQTSHTSSASNEVHHLWCVSDPKMISDLQKAFLELEEVYVADGHHRLAATKQLGRSISSLYVSADELEIHPFHRIIKLDKRDKMTSAELLRDIFNPTTFLDNLSLHYDITKSISQEPFRPDRRNRMGMFFQGNWYQLDLKREGRQLPSQPDVSLLQELILAPLLDIRNPDFDNRLQNYPDSEWNKFTLELDHSTMNIGFTLYPMLVSEFLDAARHGTLLPPKSTWITPKIPDGLLMDAGTSGTVDPSPQEIKI
ncbi:DUF1015 family protein [Pedobacter duraquae]|uniref:Uncharacterized protein (DUF1015 family) n=1 Tax=Pedobacter duraquae TaxID=425511 RepID=A0A4R6IRA7_9SPHI|nr:DUF1015 family protein [Pedobacter duraquae]TDO24929.1 uncharacterized protein (DUF1015 family) [Pedobacter duraquae]